MVSGDGHFAGTVWQEEEGSHWCRSRGRGAYREKLLPHRPASHEAHLMGSAPHSTPGWSLRIGMSLASTPALCCQEPSWDSASLQVKQTEAQFKAGIVWSSGHKSSRACLPGPKSWTQIHPRRLGCMGTKFTNNSFLRSHPHSQENT